MSNEYHITSFAVHCRPNQLADVRRSILSLPGSEIHGSSDSGQLAVTLESDNQTTMRKAMDALVNIQGVLSAALTYHRVESLEQQGDMSA